MTLDEAIRCEEKIVDGYERIQKVKAITEYELLHANNHSQILEWLKELKQLREQTRWIPVSERLPKEHSKVLVCDEENYIFVVEVSYIDGKICYNNIVAASTVRAWMPLPEPYKASPT